MRPSIQLPVGLAVILGIVFHPGPVGGRPLATATACERAVATGGHRFLQETLSALDRCQRGTTPKPCLGEPPPKAVAQLAKFLRARCDDATVEVIGFGGECVGIHRVDELVRCVRGAHTAAATDLAALVDSTAGGKCLAAILDSTVALTTARLRALDGCKRRPPTDLAPGMDCGDAAVVTRRTDPVRQRMRARIIQRCTAIGPNVPAIGLPCDGATDADALATCVLAVAGTTADTTSAATHRDPGFCGAAGGRVERRIDALLAGMTLAEKVEQMHGQTFDRGWRTPANSARGIPGLGMLDGPRGVSGFAPGTGTTFPVAIARGATFDPALEERVAEAIGAEVRAKGADVVLAPVVNIVRHPRGGRTQESYGEDTVLLGAMGTAFVRGAQQHVIASPKHLAANSIEDTRLGVDVRIDERALREVYLPHFQRVVQRGHAASIMTAYNRVNGAYCAENFHLLHDVLNADWRFRGFVESDWIEGTQSTVPSLDAGLDIEMPSARFYGQPLIDAVTADATLGATVDDAVRSILRAQFCFRLDTEPAVVDPTAVETQAHRALARAVARESIVLLQNAAGTLPLARPNLHALVVVGSIADRPNVGDHWSSSVRSSDVVTALEGIVAAVAPGLVRYIPGPTFSVDEAAAIAAADAAIVVVGLTEDDEGEGVTKVHGDRDSLVLPRAQDDLVAAVAALTTHSVVVLEGSGPVLMPWRSQVGAIVLAWYPGQEGGHAIADVLFGDVSPSGHLPLSFPVDEADLPMFDHVSSSVTYDYFHGYRYLDHRGVAPLFPFGFGLSYTTFSFGPLAVVPANVVAGDHVRVTVAVTNTGPVAGDDVVQLYVGYPGSRVERAVKDLKAFARVHLAPGETRTVALDVPTADLAFWDVDADRWEIEAITYDIGVGDSAGNLPAVGSFQVVHE